MYHLIFFLGNAWGFFCSLKKFVIVTFADFSHYSACERYHCGFNLNFLNEFWWWETFHVLIRYTYNFFIESVQVLWPFSIGLFAFSLLRCKISLFWIQVLYSGYKSFVRHLYCEYFLPVCDLPFHFLVVFWWTDIFLFLWRPIYHILYLIHYTFSKKFLPTPKW